jgi:hypothetical protein
MTLLKGYSIFSLLVAAGFFVAALSGQRMFPPIAPGSPGIFYGGGGGHGTGGYHSTWHGGK